ncbi:unnamed protein product [Mesocestoides corti]|uniref:XK-related protein n=1 Tax=Mesocestoides corti TaxID=53468 RepID=A0A0R3UMU6_MESCO|nr:unnamed protein product [Mesocestoides corti]
MNLLPPQPSRTLSQKPNLFLHRPSLLSARSRSSLVTESVSRNEEIEGRGLSGDKYFVRCNLAAGWKSSESSYISTAGLWPTVPSPVEPDLEQDEELRDYLRANRFHWWSVVTYLLALTTYLADVGCDIYLTIQYYKQGEGYWGTLTAFFVLFSSLIVMSFSLEWYVLDLRAKVEPHHSLAAWAWRIGFHVLQMAPIVRSGDFDLSERKFEDAESQALVDEDSVQTQQELAAAQSEVPQRPSSKRLHQMAKCQNMEVGSPTCVDRMTFPACQPVTKRSPCVKVSRVMKSMLSYENLKRKSCCGSKPDMRGVPTTGSVVLPRAAYSPDSTTFDYHFAVTFVGMLKGTVFWNLISYLLAKPSKDMIECHAPKPILLATATPLSALINCISRASRQTDGLVYGLQSRRKGISTQEAVQLTKLWRCENADAAMLRVMEGFMEASPQILLQLYIIFTQPASRSPSLLFPQYASCATSLLSIACCLTTYQVALRSVRVEKRDMQCCSPAPPLFFAWKLCFLSSRLLALALLAVGLRHLPAHPIPPPWPFFACLLVHWLVSFVSLVNIGTTFCTHTPGTPPELAFDATLAVMHCFDVINVREGHSRWYYTCWYTAIFIENVAAAFVWLSLSGAKGESSIVYPLVVIIMFLVGLLLMICYYKLAHPALAVSFSAFAYLSQTLIAFSPWNLSLVRRVRQAVMQV